jgi:plastocyanin
VKKILFLVAVLVLIAVSIVGVVSCGSLSSTTISEATATVTAPANTSSTSTVTVSQIEIKNYAFIPVNVTIPSGTTVTWTNLDSILHTVTSQDGTFDSGLFGQGESFSYVFNEPGEYDYYCIPHPYMTGKVTVK